MALVVVVSRVTNGRTFPYVIRKLKDCLLTTALFSLLFLHVDSFQVLLPLPQRGCLCTSACSPSTLRPQPHQWSFAATTTVEDNVVDNNSNNNDNDKISDKKANDYVWSSGFARAIAEDLTTRFGDGAARVVESWSLLDRGYEHREFVGDDDVDPSTSQMHQHAHSYVRNLGIRTFWDVEDHDWCRSLREAYPIIHQEFQTVMADANRERLVREGNNVWAGALTEDAGSYGVGWKTLVLLDRGVWDTANARIFPKTVRAIQTSNAPAAEVFFASMEGHSSIASHSDFTNFVLTCHLALDVPENGSGKCRLTVGDDTREWTNGSIYLFDTSLLHEAVNEADDTRYILMMRVWHPDLTPTERAALQHIYDCLVVPELVDPSPEVRYKAEQHLETLRAFPDLSPARGSGFGGGGGPAKTKTKPNKKKKRR